MRRRGLRELIGLCLFSALILSTSPAAAATYKIKQGDTLSGIAKKHHTTVSKLLKANHLRETSILSIDKKLYIPGSAQPSSRTHSYARSHKSVQARGYAVHVAAGSACLRAGGSSSCRRIAVLPTGTTMKLLYKNGNWAKVAMSNGTCGFVYRPLLAKGIGSDKSGPAAASTAQAPAPAQSNSSLIQTAMACRGTRYARGGTSRGGFDCSGFTRYVFAKYGVKLPHSSAAQAGHGTAISRDQLKPGDLVFFQTYRRGISHVGIYIGNNRFVHASNHGRGVTVDSLGSSYYAPRYRGARRVN